MEFSNSDLVGLWVPFGKPGLSGKLIHHHVGPYRVVGYVSQVTYKVEPLTLSPDCKHHRAGISSYFAAEAVHPACYHVPHWNVTLSVVWANLYEAPLHGITLKFRWTYI